MPTIKLQHKLPPRLRLAPIGEGQPTRLRIDPPSTATLAARLRQLEQYYDIPVRSFSAAGFDPNTVSYLWDELIAEIQHSMQIFAHIVEQKGGVENVVYDDFFDTDVAYLPILEGQDSIVLPDLCDDYIANRKGRCYLWNLRRFPPNIKSLTIGRHAFLNARCEDLRIENLELKGYRSLYAARCRRIGNIRASGTWVYTSQAYMINVEEIGTIDLTAIDTTQAILGLGLSYCHALRSFGGFIAPPADYSCYYLLAGSRIAEFTMPDGIRVTNMTGMLLYSPIETVGGVIDAMPCTSAAGAFQFCYYLTSIRIKNLGCTLNLSSSPIDSDSVSYLIANLQTVGTRRTLTLSKESAAHLTDELRNLALARSWTISY